MTCMHHATEGWHPLLADAAKATDMCGNRRCPLIIGDGAHDAFASGEMAQHTVEHVGVVPLAQVSSMPCPAFVIRAEHDEVILRRLHACFAIPFAHTTLAAVSAIRSLEWRQIDIVEAYVLHDLLE